MIQRRSSQPRPAVSKTIKAAAASKRIHLASGARPTLIVTAIGLLAGMSLSLADLYRHRKISSPKMTQQVQSAAGQTAQGPTEIPAQGWKEILVRTYKAFSADQIPAWAAGVTFFGLLALFPALSAFVSIYGLFADATKAQHQIEGLAGLLPGGAVSVISEQMQRLVAANHSRLGLAFAGSFLFSLWSANAGVKAIFGALNAAYEVKETRNFVTINLISLAFTAGLVAFSGLAIASIVAAPETLKVLGFGAAAGLAILRWPAIVLVVGLVLSLIYRYGPCRPKAKWRWITPGSIFAAIAWLLTSVGFSWYVANFGHYNATYGALGGVVGFMTWIWLSLIVVLFGAELNAEVERQTQSASHFASAAQAI